MLNLWFIYLEECLCVGWQYYVAFTPPRNFSVVTHSKQRCLEMYVIQIVPLGYYEKDNKFAGYTYQKA